MNGTKRLAGALAAVTGVWEASEDIIDMAKECGETLRETLATG